jgi:hypothetical protein
VHLAVDIRIAARRLDAELLAQLLVVRSDATVLRLELADAELEHFDPLCLALE